MLSWLATSALWLFVLVAVPYAMVGAASGYLVGLRRGRFAGFGALWGCVLGPFGWLLTLALTADEARAGLAAVVEQAGEVLGEGIDAARDLGRGAGNPTDTKSAYPDDPFA